MSKTTNRLNKLQWDDIILFDDPDYSVINKPSGISTLDDRSSDLSILSLARDIVPSATPCHRLDKETSGVLIIAKNEEAYKLMAEAFERREIKKIYHAVVIGQHEFKDEECDLPIFSSGSKSRIDRSGKNSLTLIKTVEIFRKHSLLKCFPVTGRMHQIRVHLAHYHAPIVNDPIYGGRPAFLSELKRNFNLKKFEEENPIIRRLALHAASITFNHPKTNKSIEIEAPYPKDFEVLLKQLRKFS